MDCGSCGTPHPSGALVCRGCGAGLLPPPVIPLSRERPGPAPQPRRVRRDWTTSQWLPATLENLGSLFLPLLLVVLVLVFVVDLVVLADSPDGETGPVRRGSIRLEPANVQSPDPFFGRDAGVEVPAVARSEPPDLVSRVTTGLSGKVAFGSAAGLYGSGQGDDLCDAQALAEGLSDPANAGRAQAWADVEGILPRDIRTFVGNLTAVRLRFDTRVTNHGFAGGVARPFQSVLQAGTSVLVDQRGVPRVRCFCANPLTGPQLVDGDVDEDRALDVEVMTANPDDAWEGFYPAQVVTVEPGAEIDVFVVADLATGALSEQPPGTP